MSTEKRTQIYVDQPPEPTTELRITRRGKIVGITAVLAAGVALGVAANVHLDVEQPTPEKITWVQETFESGDTVYQLVEKANPGANDNEIANLVNKASTKNLDAYPDGKSPGTTYWIPVVNPKD